MTPTTAAAPVASLLDPIPASPSTDRQGIVAEIVSAYSQIARRQHCLAGKRLMQDGISIAHLQILWLLEDRGSVSMGRLAELLGVAVANATGLVDRMEQRGLVARDRDAEDRRVVHVRPTALARTTIAQVDGWRASVLATVVDRLETGQLEQIAAGLRELRTALESASPMPTPCAPDGGTPGPAPQSTHTVDTTRTPADSILKPIEGERPDASDEPVRASPELTA